MQNIPVLAIIPFKRLGDYHTNLKLGKQKTSHLLLMLFITRFFPSEKPGFKSL